MITVDSYKETDFEVVKAFIESIQDYERVHVPELKAGAEIGSDYANRLIDTITAQQGMILLAKADDKAIGFVCAWIEEDDDMILSEDARNHAYISDIFVSENYRRQGVAQSLLEGIEKEMKSKGCQRIRICTKANNLSALKCYEANGYSPYEVILSKTIDQ